MVKGHQKSVMVHAGWCYMPHHRQKSSTNVCSPNRRRWIWIPSISAGSRSSHLQPAVQVAAGRSTHQQQLPVQGLEVDKDMEIEELDQTNAYDNNESWLKFHDVFCYFEIFSR